MVVTCSGMTRSFVSSFFALCAAFLLASNLSCDRGAPAGGGSAGAPTSGKVAGGELNPFFPADEGEFKRIFTQEKVGFVQAKLERDGNELATLSISDLGNDADALAKFENASLQIAGYPAVTRGSLGTAVLAGRFQVQVRSKTESFTADDRETWLEKFDLSGLSRLAE